MPLPISASSRPLGTAMSSVSAEPPMARRSSVDDVVRDGAERARPPAPPPPARPRGAARSGRRARDSGGPAARVMARAVAESIPPDRSTMASMEPQFRATVAPRRQARRADVPAPCEPVRRSASSTTGSTAAGATTSGSTGRWPTSAAARCSTSAAAPGACCCRCVRDGHPVVGVDRAPADAGPRRRPRRAPRRRSCAGGRCWCAAICGRSPSGAGSRSRWRRFTASSTARPTRSCCGFFRGRARARCVPGGWLAFDTFAPTRRFLERRGPLGRRRGSATRAPAGRRSTRETHALDGRVLAMTFRYQPLDAAARRRRPASAVSLRHRLLQPREIEALLARRGLDADRELGRVRRPSARSRRRERRAAHLSGTHEARSERDVDERRVA